MNPTLLPRVILSLPSKHDDRVVRADAIVTACDGNTYLPNAGPLVAAVKTAITPYKKAIADAKAKIPGAVAVRREARIALDKALEPLRLYVQSEIDAHIDLGATIAESAKMKLRKAPERSKPDFAAKDGSVSGHVQLVARAIAGAILYFWELSGDGGKTWSVAGDGTAARITISGLTVGQTYSFRFRFRTRTGMGDYSQILSHLVR